MYHCFKINDHEYTPFIAMALNNAKMDKQLKRLVSSSVRMDGLLNISFEDYMSVTLHLPSSTEQKHIADFLKKMITNQQINALVVSEGFDHEFIYYAFENFFPEYRSKVSMQTLPILSKSEFEKLMIKVPDLDVQHKISSHLAAMDRRIEHTQQELNALIEHRRGIMQQLFI